MSSLSSKVKIGHSLCEIVPEIPRKKMDGHERKTRKPHCFIVPPTSRVVPNTM